MKILGFDHCAIVTPDVIKTAAFYKETLGLSTGPRPHFAVNGEWLFREDQALVHIIENGSSPPPAALDHVSFAATGLGEFCATLRRRNVSFVLKRQPMPSNAWQLFLRDPNGVRIEINFAAGESASSAD